MDRQKVIIWTPTHRQAVIDFMRTYADRLEKQMNDESAGYGLRQIQSGALHIVDKTIPSGVEYVANHGPKQPIFSEVKVILTEEEHEKYENSF